MVRACTTFTDGQLCLQSLRKLKQRYAKTQRLTAAIKYSLARLCQRQTRRLTADEQNAKNPLDTLKAGEKKTDKFATTSDRKRKGASCSILSVSSAHFTFLPLDNDNSG